MSVIYIHIQVHINTVNIAGKLHLWAVLTVLQLFFTWLHSLFPVLDFFLVTVSKYLHVDANHNNSLASLGKLSSILRYFGISSSWLCVAWYFLFGYNTRNVYGWLNFFFFLFTIFGKSSLLQLLYIVSRNITGILCTKYSLSMVRLAWNENRNKSVFVFKFVLLCHRPREPWHSLKLPLKNSYCHILHLESLETLHYLFVMSFSCSQNLGICMNNLFLWRQSWWILVPQ